MSQPAPNPVPDQTTRQRLRKQLAALFRRCDGYALELDQHGVPYSPELYQLHEGVLQLFDAELAALAAALPEKKKLLDDYPTEPTETDYPNQAERREEALTRIGTHHGRVLGYNRAIDEVHAAIAARRGQ